MFPGINPKKMQALMKQMGIQQVEIDSARVIIEKKDGNKIIINEPSVSKVKMQGNETFQISGEVSEEQGISEEDINMVVEKTGCSKKDAEKALKETNDLADAILQLS